MPAGVTRGTAHRFAQTIFDAIESTSHRQRLRLGTNEIHPSPSGRTTVAGDVNSGCGLNVIDGESETRLCCHRYIDHLTTHSANRLNDASNNIGR